MTHFFTENRRTPHSHEVCDATWRLQWPSISCSHARGACCFPARPTVVEKRRRGSVAFTHMQSKETSPILHGFSRVLKLPYDLYKRCIMPDSSLCSITCLPRK